MKNNKQLNMGFTLLLMVVGVIIGFSLATFINKPEDLGKNVVYQDEAMRIEVIEVEDGLKDVYIEPLDGRNVVTNFDMDSRVNDIDAYLSVRTKENAERLYKTMKSNFPNNVDWDFNWATKD